MNKIYQRNYQVNNMVSGGSIGVKENKIIILNNIIQQPDTATKENLGQELSKTSNKIIIDLETANTDTQKNIVTTDIEDVPKQLEKSKKKMFGR